MDRCGIITYTDLTHIVVNAVGITKDAAAVHCVPVSVNDFTKNAKIYKPFFAEKTFSLANYCELSKNTIKTWLMFD